MKKHPFAVQEASRQEAKRLGIGARKPNVALCQDVERLTSIDLHDFDWTDPGFRSYVRARIGFNGIVRADGAFMSPSEVVAEVENNLDRWRLLRAQIQDCFNIYRNREREYLK